MTTRDKRRLKEEERKTDSSVCILAAALDITSVEAWDLVNGCSRRLSPLSWIFK